MVTIDNIDFSKLKPYDGKVTKCFEQLCYQIAQKEFGNLGIFTPIDGSGGDGGVEFYLNLTNGEKWGWQCKFFGDTFRLYFGPFFTPCVKVVFRFCAGDFACDGACHFCVKKSGKRREKVPKSDTRS
jgi:hypothetical protein